MYSNQNVLIKPQKKVLQNEKIVMYEEWKKQA